MNLSPRGDNLPPRGGYKELDCSYNFNSQFNSIELNGVLYIPNLSRPQVGPKSSRSILYKEISSKSS